jgi:hypothetical protein
MPRKSAAARAADRFRPGIEHPQPPSGMGEAAERIWRDIVENRPVDFFTTGSLNMLRTFCEASAMLEQLGPEAVASPHDYEIFERFRRMGLMQAVIGQKLRLSIQSELRIRTARNIEKLEPARPQRPELFGGRAAWRDKTTPAN